MADNHSKEVRSKNMSHIRSTNTKPEEIVRKYLFSFTGSPVKEGKKSTPEKGVAKDKNVIDRLFNAPFRGRPQELGPCGVWSNHPFNRWF